MVLSGVDDEPIEVILVMVGNPGACVAVKEPGAAVEPAGTCDETPGYVEELDGGNDPDVGRAESALLDSSPEGTDDIPLVLGITVEGVTTEPVKEAIDVPEVGLVPTTELVPTPTDEVLPWPLKVSAPVFAEVIRGPEGEVMPAVGDVLSLLIELIPARDENGPLLVVDKTSEAEPEMVDVAPLVIPAGGKEVAPGPPVLSVKLVPPEESGETLPDTETEASEAEAEPGVGVLPEVSPVMDDAPGVEITVELGVVKGAPVEREPAGDSDPPEAVVTIPPELTPVPDANEAVLLDTENPVGLVRVKGGLIVSEFVDVNDKVSFSTGIAVVRVVPVMVVGRTVSTVGEVTVISTEVVNVLAVTVVGDTVSVSIEDEISILLVIPELNPELSEPGGLFDAVEFATGYGAELDSCSDTAEELPLTLVRLGPGKDPDVRAAPEDVAVTMGVVSPPLGIDVALIGLDELVAGKGGMLLDNEPVELTPAPVSTPEDGTVFVPTSGFLGTGYGPVEEPVTNPEVPVISGGMMPDSEPVLGTPGDPGVKLLELMGVEAEAVVRASVERLNPLMRLPLGLTELSSMDEMGDVIEETPKLPLLLGYPVGPAVAAVELVIENDPLFPVGYEPVPVADSLELLSGNGAVEEILEKGVPEDDTVTLLVVASEEPGSGALDDIGDPGVVDREAPDEEPVIVGRGPVPMVVPLTPEVELLGGYRAVCEVFCEAATEVVACPGCGPFIDSLAETEPTPELVSTPVPPAEPPVGPPVGSEEFVIGKGVTSLAATELPMLVLVDNVTENDPETGIVDELGTPKDVFVAVADESDEFVNGKGVAVLVALTVGIEELAKGYRLVSVELGLDPDDKGTLVSPAEPPVGLKTCVEELVSGNGAVSLALAEVRLAVGIEPVLFAGNGVEMGMDSVLKADVLVMLDWVLVGFVTGVDVFVKGYGMVSLALEEIPEPVGYAIDDVNGPSEAEPAVPLSGPPVGVPISVDEFVRENSVVSVAPIEDPVIVGIKLGDEGNVENPVLIIEFDPVGPGVATVEFRIG
ncbi:hypothetical protein F5Y07DRAFT_406540 [Xylaria sp. FL0933]|nr:hypothetical protein F5Y07DRAFT_406540 [Xylaria sp. FL0933]